MAEINLVYQDHSGESVVHYDGPEGKVWMSNHRRKLMHNVFLSCYAAKDRKPVDSIFVLEPRCVNERDYDIAFLNQFKYVFSWAEKAFRGTQITPKLIGLNHPSCKFAPSVDSLVPKWKPWSERKDQIVIIANKKFSRHSSEIYRLRVKLADWLSNNSKYKVAWYGNPPKNRTYSRGRIPQKFPILNDVKFSICSENCYHPKFSHGYFTEKMPEVWFGAAVPLYMGCYNIDEFGFGPNQYIDLRKYVNKDAKDLKIAFGKLKERIESYDEAAYQQYRKELEENMRKPDGLYHVISYDRVYKKLFEVLCK